MNLSKKEIEKAKDVLNNYKFLFSKNARENADTYINNHYTKVCRDSMETLLQYIDQLEQENNKRNESAYWKGYIQKQNEAMEICKICKYRKKYFKRIEEEAKQYFEKKVEEK